MKCQRDLFSLPDGQHYLNCAYMSPLLKAAETAGINGLRRKAMPAEITPVDFFEPAEELRRTFSPPHSHLARTDRSRPRGQLWDGYRDIQPAAHTGTERRDSR